MPSKLLPLMLGLCFSAAAQITALPLAKETLTYSIEWRLITAGKARMQWDPLPLPRGGYTVNLHLESAGLVSKLYRVEDDYTAQLNQALCVQSSLLKAREGSRQRETRITFDAESKKATYLEQDRVKNSVVLSQQIDVPACTHDVTGGLYFLRSSPPEVPQSKEIPISDGKKSVMARVEAQAHEDIKTPAGSFKTTRYEIYLFNNVLYRRPAHLYVWLTDDRRRLPVQIRVRMQFTIGTITLLLEKVE
jgi:hypothetical protein